MEFLPTGVCNNSNTDQMRWGVFFGNVFNHELTPWLKAVENPLPV